MIKLLAYTRVKWRVTLRSRRIARVIFSLFIRSRCVHVITRIPRQSHFPFSDISWQDKAVYCAFRRKTENFKKSALVSSSCSFQFYKTNAAHQSAFKASAKLTASDSLPNNIQRINSIKSIFKYDSLIDKLYSYEKTVWNFFFKKKNGIESMFLEFLN